MLTTLLLFFNLSRYFIECNKGYYGDNCQSKCNCHESNTANCTRNGICICRDGFYGRYCQRSTDIKE